MKPAVDCIVLGGGPAGSMVAALVAGAGFRTLLVERQRSSRSPGGATLIPLGCGTLHRLGLAEKLPQAGFIPSHGLELVGATGEPRERFSYRPNPAAAFASAWQVDRSRFDELLWQHAARAGAQWRQHARPMGLLTEGGRATGVRLEHDDGRSEEVFGRVIVDATGGETLPAEALSAEQPPVRDPKSPPEQLAIWGHYENADLARGPDAGSTLLVQTRDRRAWFWFVPLPGNIAAIGVVGHPQHLANGVAKPESAFEEQLVQCPAVVERLAAAKLSGPFRVARSLCAHARPAAGDGWVSLGDALAGWGPLFSFGLSQALRGGELAAAATVEALAAGDSSATGLGSWLEGFGESQQALRRLVAAFATAGFSPFEFLARHPLDRGPLAALFSGEAGEPATGALLADLDAWILDRHPETGRPQVTR